MSATPKDPWENLARWTPARIALGRAGASLPTQEVLRFALAHAQARDAVHAAFGGKRIAAEVRELGLVAIEVESEATERGFYLRRPDLGRQLSARSSAALGGYGEGPADLAIVVGDGLSAAAIHAHAVSLIQALQPRLAALGLTLAPVAIARGARVALGDEIGLRLAARAVAVLIGERPGLSSPDSLGIYLTFDPRPGRSDAERNCISNVRDEGLGYDVAAFKLTWLLREALRRKLTGVALKDESDTLLCGGDAPLLAP